MAAGKGGFGNYRVCFAGCKQTLESVYGNQPMKPSEMNKAIWKFIRENKLSSSTPKTEEPKK